MPTVLDLSTNFLWAHLHPLINPDAEILSLHIFITFFINSVIDSSSSPPLSHTQFTIHRRDNFFFLGSKMDSETASRDVHDTSLVERLISSRNRDLALLLPFILGFTNITTNTDPIRDSQNPDEQAQENPTQLHHDHSRDRLILVNPFTQGMVVIEAGSSSSSSLDSLLSDLLSNKDGQAPATKASIEAMPSVQICEDNVEGECVICLEEWKIGEICKEMPCMHKFHGECIEKWLKIHGSCPICRFKMPTDNDDVNKKGDHLHQDENRGRRRRDVWLSFSFSRDRPNGDINHTPVNESSDT